MKPVAAWTYSAVPQVSGLANKDSYEPHDDNDGK
jgi:hypothetical protein